MLLHLVVDDKFIDGARRVFEAAEPQNNRYLLLREEIGNRTPKFLTSFEPERVALDDLGRLIASERSSIDGVVVHYMTGSAKKAVARMPAGIPVVWIGWGSDYYHLIRAPGSLLRERTRTLVAALKRGGGGGGDRQRRAAWAVGGAVQRAMGLLRRAYGGFRRLSAQPVERRALSRVDYFAPVIAEDAELLKSRNEWFRPSVLRWNYPLADSVLDRIDRDGGVTGQDILLGNSAFPENNHVDAFAVLQPLMERTNRRIICPLSYGDPRYAEAIAGEGHRRFGERFVALRQFLPPVEYWQTVRSCSTVVMAHLRQQAIGNIVMMMYAGASVYLDPESPAFEFFARIQLPVRPLEELHLDTHTPMDVISVRTRVRQHFGADAMVHRTRDLVDAIRSKAAATSHP